MYKTILYYYFLKLMAQTSATEGLQKWRWPGQVTAVSWFRRLHLKCGQSGREVIELVTTVGDLEMITQNLTSRNEQAFWKFKFSWYFLGNYNELGPAKEALKYSLYNPHNNLVRWTLSLLFYRGKKIKNYSCKSRGHTLIGWTPQPLTSPIHSTAGVSIYSSNTYRSE